MKRDIVYILKNDIQPDELRYSLRSVCENFPYRKIVFVGGCPEGITSDIYIPHQQTGQNKWQKVMSSMRKAFSDESLTEEIFLFNDDFFILSPVDTENFVNFTDGTLGRRIRKLEEHIKRKSNYSKRLRNLFVLLKTMDRDTMSFTVHMPMLINRHKALEMIEKFPEQQMFRSLYGNLHEIPYTYHRDVKIYTNDKLPDWDDYLSTTEGSFQEGLVGEYIRNKFPRPCKYELTRHSYVHELYTEEGDERYSIMPLEERS